MPGIIYDSSPYIGEVARQDMLLSYGHYIKNLEHLTPLRMPRLADHPEIQTGHDRPQAL